MQVKYRKNIKIIKESGHKKKNYLLDIKINKYYQLFQNTTFIKTCHRFCLPDVSLLSLTSKSSITTK